MNFSSFSNFLHFKLRPFTLFNPLSANFTKWSNTLKQFVGKLLTNFLSVFDHFVGLVLKRLMLYYWPLLRLIDLLKWVSKAGSITIYMYRWVLLINNPLNNAVYLNCNIKSVYKRKSETQLRCFHSGNKTEVKRLGKTPAEKYLRKLTNSKFDIKANLIISWKAKFLRM